MQAKHKESRLYPMLEHNFLNLKNKRRVLQFAQAEGKDNTLLVLPYALAAPQIDLFAGLVNQRQGKYPQSSTRTPAPE